MKCQQEELSLIFLESTFEELVRRNRIRDLSVVVKPRLRTNWYLTYDPATSMRTLYVPKVLQHAPEPVKTALLQWARLPWHPRRKRRAEVRKIKRELEKKIWAYLTDTGVKQRARKLDPQALAKQTKGTVYDLAVLAWDVNNTYFDGAIKTSIRWGTYASTTSYQTHAQDPDNQRFSVITIAGVYDHPDVPRFALESVIFHEMLHIVVPTYKKNGRNVFHGPEFKRLERSFPHYAQWRLWERHNMGRLVRSLKRRKRWK